MQDCPAQAQRHADGLGLTASIDAASSSWQVGAAMNALILSAGLDLAFAVFHLAFWRLFDWPRRLRPSGVVNAAVTQTLNLMLTFVFAVYSAALLWTPPSAALLWAGAAFWFLRLLAQPTFFPMRNAPSLAISAAFAVAGGLHALAALGA